MSELKATTAQEIVRNEKGLQAPPEQLESLFNRLCRQSENILPTKGVEMMEEKKFEIKIDPLDFHVGLKDNMAEFESLIRMKMSRKKLAEQVEKDLKSRFCHCCFFGHVEGELMGEPLCKECAKVLYGFDTDEERPSIKKIDPYYQLWYRRKKALPIFEAYLHAELERFKLEQKLAEAKK